MTDQLQPVVGTTHRAGTLLGDRYRFEELIANGGMAQVWRATDEVLNRTVAVKLLHQHLSDDESFLQRFRAEAISAARLNHRNIVAIYDTVGRACADDLIDLTKPANAANGQLEAPTEAPTEAIVMELIDGHTLRDLMNQPGPVDVNEVVRIVGAVATALDVAHQSSVVHRDIKPSNILIATDGRVVVTDFGIAKAERSLDLTRTGDVMGTAKYLAPEQVTGDQVDGRADLYSLGVVLYEAVCGRPPFDGGNQMATAIARTQSDPPKPRLIQPGCSKELEAVLLRALERNPADRFGSGADFRLAINEAIDAGGVPADLDAPLPAPVISVADEETTSQSLAQAERTWMIPAFGVIGIAGALILAAVFFGGTSTGRDLVRETADAVGISEQEPVAAPTETVPVPPVDPDLSGQPVGFVASAALDPFGDSTEHGDKAPLVHDDNPATFWRTEQYNNRQFGSLKPGVGLWVALDEVTDLQTLLITSSATDWSADIYVATGAGATLEEWGTPVESLTGLSAETSVDLTGLSGDAVLIWITDLGEGPTPLRLEIAEVAILAA